MLIKFDFIKICMSFSTAFPWVWSLSDSTKPNDFGYVKDFDAVSQCEDEIPLKVGFSVKTPVILPPV